MSKLQENPREIAAGRMGNASSGDGRIRDLPLESRVLDDLEQGVMADLAGVEIHPRESGLQVDADTRHAGQIPEAPDELARATGAGHAVYLDGGCLDGACHFISFFIRSRMPASSEEWQAGFFRGARKRASIGKMLFIRMLESRVADGFEHVVMEEIVGDEFQLHLVGFQVEADARYAGNLPEFSDDFAAFVAACDVVQLDGSGCHFISFS
jgi:hypothetical protein